MPLRRGPHPSKSRWPSSRRWNAGKSSRRSWAPRPASAVGASGLWSRERSHPDRVIVYESYTLAMGDIMLRIEALEIDDHILDKIESKHGWHGMKPRRLVTPSSGMSGADVTASTRSSAAQWRVATC